VCSVDELESSKADYLQAKHQVHDLLRHDQDQGLTWDHDKGPDQEHPSELRVQLTLDIYKFPAWKQHGDPSCGQPGERRPRGAPEPAPQPPPTKP